MVVQSRSTDRKQSSTAEPFVCKGFISAAQTVLCLESKKALAEIFTHWLLRPWTAIPINLGVFHQLVDVFSAKVAHRRASGPAIRDISSANGIGGNFDVVLCTIWGIWTPVTMIPSSAFCLYTKLLCLSSMPARVRHPCWDTHRFPNYGCHESMPWR